MPELRDMNTIKYFGARNTKKTRRSNWSKKGQSLSCEALNVDSNCHRDSASLDSLAFTAVAGMAVGTMTIWKSMVKILPN